ASPGRPSGARGCEAAARYQCLHRDHQSRRARPPAPGASQLVGAAAVSRQRPPPRCPLAWYPHDATMITLVEALNFRCLHHVRQTLGQFHVLVGPNASGKTTFLDVVSFLGDLVTDGPAEAIRARTQNFVDLLWGRQGDSFQVAIEA